MCLFVFVRIAYLNRLIDFNGTSICLRLFYALIFKNHVSCKSMVRFFMKSFFFIRSHRKQAIFKTGVFDPVLQFRVHLGVMAMKGYATCPNLQNWSLTVKCNLVSYPGHPFFLQKGSSYPPQGDTVRIL